MCRLLIVLASEAFNRGMFEAQPTHKRTPSFQSDVMPLAHFDNIHPGHEWMKVHLFIERMWSLSARDKDNERSTWFKTGSSTPCSLSTQVPHSGQSSCFFDACSAPRCSTHPGQVQSKPQVQPVPAKDAIVLRGGIAGNSGGTSQGIDERSRGGRIGPRLFRSSSGGGEDE